MASRIELVLDRFIVWGDGGRAVDLATGDLVWLRAMAPHGGVDGLRRAQAAARVSALRIRGMAALVDFGLDGLAGWVEAYRPAASGADAATIVALLARAGCAVREPARSTGQDPPMEGQFVPAPLDLVTIDEPAATAPPAAAAASGPALGTLLERRDELDAIAEVIAGQAEAGARIVRIGAPPGAGLRTLFAAIAREARLAGYVPVSSAFCGDSPSVPAGLDGPLLCAALRDRHVVILDAPAHAARPADGGGITRFLSRLDTAGGRPHAVLCGRLPLPGEAPITLGPMRPEQLRRTVLCAGIDEDRVAQAIDEALRRSGGWPGPFASLMEELLGLRAAHATCRFPALGAGASSVREAAPQPRDADGAAPREQAQASAVLARARGLVQRGRHAAAERLLRRTVGHLRRRRCSADEARAQLELGRLLMARGRRPGAREAFEASRRLSDEAQDASGVVVALLHLGALHIEDGALPEAESVLRTADVGSARAALPDLGRAARLLLARSLYWQGRHDDAWRLVERSGGCAGDRLDEATAVAERAESGTPGASWGDPVDTGRPPARASRLPPPKSACGWRSHATTRDWRRGGWPRPARLARTWARCMPARSSRCGCSSRAPWARAARSGARRPPALR